MVGLGGGVSFVGPLRCACSEFYIVRKDRARTGILRVFRVVYRKDVVVVELGGGGRRSSGSWGEVCT